MIKLHNLLPTYRFGLLSWWRRRREAALAHLHFVFYTRRGCHLCDSAWQQLRLAQRRHHFLLAKVDIAADSELALRYGGLVPVVAVNGKIRFRGAVNPVLLDRLLRAEQDKAIRALKKPEPRRSSGAE